MPLYTYECQDHGLFEKVQKIAERKVAFCPVCNYKAKLVASPFSFRFAGQVSNLVKKQLSKGVKEDTKDWRWDSKQLEKVM